MLWTLIRIVPSQSLCIIFYSKTIHQQVRESSAFIPQMSFPVQAVVVLGTVATMYQICCCRSEAQHPCSARAKCTDCGMLACSGHGVTSEHEESSDDEHEAVDAMQDSYLKVSAMQRSWQPLIAHVTVDGLPRGAAVELQPFALTAAAGASAVSQHAAIITLATFMHIGSEACPHQAWYRSISWPNTLSYRGHQVWLI